MDLIERLRPRWRHPDPEVRAAAVREMGGDEQRRLGAIARSDADARVRRIAIRKLDDAEVLEHVAGGDADPALRVLAGERLRQVLVAVASSSRPLSQCAAALSRLGDDRSLAAVASAGAHEAIRRDALSRAAGDRVLREIVRSAADPTIRREALARIRDAAVLRGIALGDCPPELALEALERIDDAEALQAIAEHRGAPKSVSRRARERLAGTSGERLPVGFKAGRARQLELCTMVHALRADPDVMQAAGRVREAQREWQELGRDVEARDDVAQRFAAACEAILADAALLARREAHVEGTRTALEEHLAARRTLCERVEALDGAGAARELAEARAAWRRLPPVSDDRGAELARRFTAAGEACEVRHQRWLAREGLEGLTAEAEALADDSSPPSPNAWKALQRRWADLEPPGTTSDDVVLLRRRFASAGERLQRRWQEAEEHQHELRRQNLARLEALCDRLEAMAQSEAWKPGAARRQLEAADAALRELGPLPASERRAAWTERLTEARGRLLRRAREMEETEEWRRWANAAAQEEIIRRVEGLLESNDLAEGTRQLGRLQQEWEQVATATPDKSRALWERFRAARNELRKRCDAYLAENLQKKRALCEQVAGLGDSTAWNETADLIRRLQAEWKQIGAVPGQHARTLWQRFRDPCDRFFERRKEHFARVDGERRENAQKRAALCEQAEALAGSTDWEEAATAIKRLQAEWKRSGAPARAETEALWQRFRAACDHFFDRYRRRDELAREAARDQARAICERLEARAASLAGEQAAAEPSPQQIDEAWSEWLRLDLTLEDASALTQRLQTACEQIAAADPERLRGTRLDPAATRKGREKLCRRLDEMLASLSGPAREMSLQEMALALRERLATNTIVGATGSQTSRQEAAREAERIDAAWARLGPVLGEDARALAERFEGTRARLREAMK